MSNETRVTHDDAAELRRRLHALGHEPAYPPRDRALELARADRVAASLDQGLQRLVRRRSHLRLAMFTVVASAALVLLALALRTGMPDRGLPIAREPLSLPEPEAPSASLPAVPTELPSPAPAPAQEAPRRANSAPAIPAPSPSASASTSAGSEPRSTLGEENRLFQEAVEASRRGDVDAALGPLERLLHDFPGSPLAQTALVRKFRLLAKAGRAAEAARVADQYLKSFPTGFAVSEARALQGTAPVPSPVSSGDIRSEP